MNDPFMLQKKTYTSKELDFMPRIEVRKMISDMWLPEELLEKYESFEKQLDDTLPLLEDLLERKDQMNNMIQDLDNHSNVNTDLLKQQLIGLDIAFEELLDDRGEVRDKRLELLKIVFNLSKN